MDERTLTRARTADDDAFRELTDRHRHELQLHCYRLLGSVQDAEDVVQETALAAWRGLAQFEGRASLRAWLYRIATNRSLNALRDASRRPRETEGPALPPDRPEPTRHGEPTWLQPYPDVLLESLPDAAPGPEARYEAREAIGLAFVAGLQRLPPRQRAALVLRDVLGFNASETAEMLGVTEASANGALRRARAALGEGSERDRAPLPDSAAERELVARFVEAFEGGDVEGVVALLTEDASLTMPPTPLEYVGRVAIAGFLLHGSGGRAPGSLPAGGHARERPAG